MKDFPRLILKSGEGRRVERGHLWIFSNEIERLDDRGDKDEVSVFSARGRYIGNALLSPSSLIRARIYSRNVEPCSDELIQRRITDALNYRKTIGYFRNSYRLIYSEGDMLPGLVVDVYADHVVMQIGTMSMDNRRNMIIEALKRILKPACIYERSDISTRENEGLVSRNECIQGSLQNPLEIKERDVSFLIDISGGQKTGYFLDQVENRARLLPFVQNRKVLDLFCYVGAWALMSLRYGAKSAVGVDSSEAAIKLAQLAAARNGLTPMCCFEKADAFEFLTRNYMNGTKFDCIIIDPPPLARRKKDVSEALKAYRDLHMRALRILPCGGILATASCSYHVSPDEFLQIIRFAAKDTRTDLRLLYSGEQSPDHPIHLGTPETGYLKFYAFTKV